jgi:RNA polymerase sigma-70 factor (ECF subfamily)
MNSGNKNTLVKELNEDQIVALIRTDAGFESGFRNLVQRYQERLYWHIRRMVDNHDDANDIIQNTLIRVYKSINRFEGKSSLYTWLYRIATNETLTFINKKKKKATIGIDNEMNTLEQKLVSDDYFDGDFIQISLYKAINTLPEKQKLVFNMRYYDEMSYKEISDILETSVGGLKASYHHAVKKIEKYIKDIDL